MKRLFISLLLLLFLLGVTEQGEGALPSLMRRGFYRWMEGESARQFFDLEEEEAKEVFGDFGEAFYL